MVVGVSGSTLMSFKQGRGIDPPLCMESQPLGTLYPLVGRPDAKEISQVQRIWILIQKIK